MKPVWLIPFALLTLGALEVRAQQPAADSKAASAASASEASPAPEYKTPTWGVIPAPAWPAPPSPPAPEKVTIPKDTSFAVTLDTPLSTRISKAGQLVNFRTTDAFPVYEGLVIPPDTIFSGSVIEARKPGSFGKAGVIRVKVDHIQLANGANAEVTARLESQDLNAQGRLQSDKSGKSKLINLALWAGQGSLLGLELDGAKGAGIGAGAGAAVALIIMMSRRGADIYLEPGTPFAVKLDEPLSLPGRAVQEIQPSTTATDAVVDGNGSPSAATTDPATDPARPELKHRPPKKPPN